MNNYTRLMEMCLQKSSPYLNLHRYLARYLQDEDFYQEMALQCCLAIQGSDISLRVARKRVMDRMFNYIVSCSLIGLTPTSYKQLKKAGTLDQYVIKSSEQVEWKGA